MRWGGRSRRNSKGEAGFSLVEVLIALFVFAIASLAIAAMTFMSIRGNAMTNQMSQATFLAQDKMEELLTLQTYSQLKTTGLTTVSDQVAGDQTGGGVYTRSWAATSCNNGVPPTVWRPAPVVPPNPGDPPLPSACWVTVTVGWVDSKGNHQVNARSLWRVN